LKVKFSKYERVAGIFVGIAIVGSLAAWIGVGISKGWLASKVKFETVMNSAEGLRPGTVVQIAGLRAGSVDDIELESSSRVRVHFKVFSKFHGQIRRDSSVQVLRPFVIGEKVLEITVGSTSEPILAGGSEIPVISNFDIMDLFSGRKLGPFMETIEKLSENFRVLGEAFADPKRTQALVKVFDRMEPLVLNLSRMSEEMTKVARTANRENRIDTIVKNLVAISDGLNKIVPELADEVPDMGRQMAQVVANLNTLTTEFKKLTPAITAVAPELPKASLRAVEALNETVVLLKAMQRSFLLRGNVKDVKEEESQRQPASEK